MMVFYFEHKCPMCDATFDVQVLGISSNLGPPTQVCPACDYAVHTGRREWAEMSGLGKTRYLLVSLLYLAVLGTGLAFSVAGCLIFLVYGPHAQRIPFEFHHIFWIIPIFVLAVALLQGSRVYRSLQRTGGHSLSFAAYRPPLLLRNGWQLLMMALMIAPILLGGLLAYLLALVGVYGRG